MEVFHGIQLLDLTTGQAASLSTATLADFGATVYKIERPSTPDPARSWAPIQQGHSTYFTYLNRGKRSLCLDYTSVQGQTILRQLIQQSDILLHSFSRQELADYGLDYGSLVPLQPGLIHASLTPFGQTGPLAGKPAEDLTLQALSGMMDRTGFPTGPATPAGCRIGHHISGAYLTMALSLALIHRKRTGQGQEIDLSQLDCLFAMMETGPWVYNITGEVLPRTGNTYPSTCPYDTLPTKDGLISVGISTDAQWQTFCKVLDQPELAQEERYLQNQSRGAHYADDLRPKLVAITQQYGKFELEKRLRGAKLACAAVCTISEVMGSQHIADRHMLVTVEDEGAGTVTLPGIPIQLTKTPGTIQSGASVLGSHTAETLRQLGYTPEELTSLANQHIIQQAEEVAT